MNLAGLYRMIISTIRGKDQPTGIAIPPEEWDAIRTELIANLKSWEPGPVSNPACSVPNFMVAGITIVALPKYGNDAKG